MEMFYALGPHLHLDPVLLCKLIRIGKAYFKEVLLVSDSPQRTLAPEHMDNVSL